ncbi:hypothetical protein C5167_002399 [Papaver somniferum]|uniref:Alpha-soluble NSF attachment protein n=1 Tax=Papaver somniferum TaxID=3469 RepID=A0A4Y7KZI1_PAPSO|nr:hypothetical protein C5167_002399 [Papaver somniferum]
MAGLYSLLNMKMLLICMKNLPILSKSPKHGIELQKYTSNWLSDMDGSGMALRHKALGWCMLWLDSKHEAASAYVDAANAYKKISPKDAISCLEQAVGQFMEIGRFNMAARYCKEIGELGEAQQNVDQAIAYFEHAADLFQSEEVNTSANQCKLKVAEFAAQQEQYPKAIEIYEEIARQSLNNNLLKYSVKGYLLNAGLCQLCKDDDLDPTFTGTRECKLLTDLAAAMDEEDIGKFTDADAWKTTMLLRAKEALKAKEDGPDPDLT